MEAAQLHSILLKTVHPGAELASCTLLKAKPDYWVWEAMLQQPSLRLIVKIAGEGAEYSSRFEQTAAIHRLVQEQTTIPIPEILLADESYQSWPWKLFIKTYIPGQEFAAIREGMTGAERNAAMAEIGDAVAQIHAIRFNVFGDIGSDGQVNPGMTCIEGLKDHAERILPDADLRKRFLAALEPREARFASARQASLCHEDLHAHNILFERRSGSWHLATILDFEKAWAGLPDSDLARMDLWSMTGDAFWQAYTARLPVDPNYPVRRALLQWLWCLEVNWDTPTHQATMQSVLQELRG